MNRIVFFGILLFLFSSCEKDTVDYGLGEYYKEIATVLEENYTYLLDNGETLYEINPRNNASYETGRRVLLIYSYIGEKTTTSAPQAITVHGASAIAQGKLKAVSKEELATFDNHPIRMESIWIGSHYLNLRFYLEYKSEAHTIALLCDENDLDKKEINLYFKHDTNNDPPGYFSSMQTSFDLSQVLGEPKGDRTLLVNIQTDNYGNKDYQFNY